MDSKKFKSLSPDEKRRLIQEGIRQASGGASKEEDESVDKYIKVPGISDFRAPDVGVIKRDPEAEANRAIADSFNRKLRLESPEVERKRMPAAIDKPRSMQPAPRPVVREEEIMEEPQAPSPQLQLRPMPTDTREGTMSPEEEHAAKQAAYMEYLKRMSNKGQ